MISFLVRHERPIHSSSEVILKIIPPTPYCYLVIVEGEGVGTNRPAISVIDHRTKFIIGIRPYCTGFWFDRYPTRKSFNIEVRHVRKIEFVTPSPTAPFGMLRYI